MSNVRDTMSLFLSVKPVVLDDGDRDRRVTIKYKIEKYLLRAEKIYNLYLSPEMKAIHMQEQVFDFVFRLCKLFLRPFSANSQNPRSTKAVSRPVQVQSIENHRFRYVGHTFRVAAAVLHEGKTFF